MDADPCPGTSQSNRDALLVSGAGVVLVGVVTHLVVSAIYGGLFDLVVGCRTSAGAAFRYGLFYGVLISAFYLVLPSFNETMRARVALQAGWWFVYLFSAVLLVTPLLARACSSARQYHLTG